MCRFLFIFAQFVFYLLLRFFFFCGDGGAHPPLKINQKMIGVGLSSTSALVFLITIPLRMSACMNGFYFHSRNLPTDLLCSGAELQEFPEFDRCWCRDSGIQESSRLSPGMKECNCRLAQQGGCQRTGGNH